MQQPNARPDPSRPVASGPSVAWILVAPVKALALESLPGVRVGPRGIEGDRQFALLDSASRLVNGKRVGRLVLLRPSFDPATRRLAVRFPDGRVVEDVALPADSVEGVFFGEPRPARLVPGPWSAAISAWSGVDLRLVELPVGSGPDRGQPGGSVTMLSVAALQTLAAEGGATEPLDERRFRMTFGVDGVAAHAEDAWVGRCVRLGGAVIQLRGNVGRCAVTTQDPDTGVADFDTLGALARSRGDVTTSEPLPMGVWGTVVEPGDVRLGDPVAMLDGTDG